MFRCKSVPKAKLYIWYLVFRVGTMLVDKEEGFREIFTYSFLLVASEQISRMDRSLS